MKDTAKLRLVIVVTYQLNGVKIDEPGVRDLEMGDLESALANVAINAFANGCFTGSTPAEVKSWGWKVVQAPVKKGVKSGKRKNPTG